MKYSEKTPDQIFKEDLKILLDIKKSVGQLNNAIHDKVALLAISTLKKQHDDLEFVYQGAGVGGLDLIGKRGNKEELVAEIKTITIEKGVTLKGPQIKIIKKDLIRLKKSKAKYKYFIVITDKVENNIKKRLDFKKEFKEIKVLNVL